jgi:hypothetical protein
LLFKTILARLEGFLALDILPGNRYSATFPRKKTLKNIPRKKNFQVLKTGNRKGRNNENFRLKLTSAIVMGNN